VRVGVLEGRHEAAAVLVEREGDGLTTDEVNRPYPGVPSPGPGDYVLTPPDFAPGQQSGERDARPFLLGEVDRFEPGPPPALDLITSRGKQEASPMCDTAHEPLPNLLPGALRIRR